MDYFHDELDIDNTEVAIRCFRRIVAMSRLIVSSRCRRPAARDGLRPGLAPRGPIPPSLPLTRRRCCPP